MIPIHRLFYYGKLMGVLQTIYFFVLVPFWAIITIYAIITLWP